MDKFSGVVNDEEFSKLSFVIAKFPKSLVHWEEFLNFLISKAFPLNKSLHQRLYKLIETTYDSMLFNFPYLENYYIDYALFEYKLGHVAKMHKIYQRGLKVFKQRSLHLWTSYLKLCNEVLVSNKQLFQKYETAEKYIGLHYYSGGFWELYMEQIKERCANEVRYFIVLRKVLEIPQHSFSKFYGLWLQYIDEAQDLSQLNKFASNDDLLKKLKIDTSYRGRRGPYLLECKKLLKKFTKELYMVVQYQVLEIYSLFESKLTTHYYSCPENLIPAGEIETWDKYLDYTIMQRIDGWTHLNFQRTLMPLGHYEMMWLKYAHWLIESKADLVTAKNVLIEGLSMSLKKNNIMRLLYSILCKLNDYDVLAVILQENELANGSHVEDVDDFEIFWDYIQFRIFCTNGMSTSRYSESNASSFVAPEILDMIIRRLSHTSMKEGQLLLLSSILQLQNKSNSVLIEEKIFKHIVESGWKYYLQKGKFWSLYCRLTFFDPTLSYLEKRRRIVNQVWPQAKSQEVDTTEPIREFCQSYLPEDLDSFEQLFDL